MQGSTYSPPAILVVANDVNSTSFLQQTENLRIYKKKQLTLASKLVSALKTFANAALLYARFKLLNGDVTLMTFSLFFY